MDWSDYMKQWHETIMETSYHKDFRIPKLRWSGFPGVRKTELSSLERRLEMELPHSYKSFLAFSNGWRNLSWKIDQLWSVDKIKWFREDNQDWIDAYAEPYLEEPAVTDEEHQIYGEKQSTIVFKIEYLKHCLQISKEGEGCVFLLNPLIVDDEGEWEAWFFDNKLAGAQRFRSFSDLMQNHYQEYVSDFLNK